MLSHIWVKFESDLDQISTRSLTSFNQFWHIHNRQWHHQYKWRNLAVSEKSLVSELSRTQKSVYISSCLLISIFSFSLQSYRKFSAKSVLKLFEFNSTFKNSHMIVFCILHQAQSKVFTLALINSEVSVCFYE